MNASELKRKVEANNPNSKYFTRNNMRFAGDTMRNYGVCSSKVMLHSGETVEVWQLYRRKATSKGLTSSVFWYKDTFAQAWIAKVVD